MVPITIATIRTISIDKGWVVLYKFYPIEHYDSKNLTCCTSTWSIYNTTCDQSGIISGLINYNYQDLRKMLIEKAQCGFEVEQ